MTTKRFTSNAQESEARAIDYMKLHASIIRVSTELTGLEKMFKQEHDAYIAVIYYTQGQIAEEEELENGIALMKTMAILLCGNDGGEFVNSSWSCSFS